MTQTTAAKPSPKPELASFSTAASASVADRWPLPNREDWGGLSLDDAHLLIQRLMASYQEGAAILNQRIYDNSRVNNTYKCLVCGETKPQTVDNHPNYVWRDDRRDPRSGLYNTKFICSSRCYHGASNSGALTERKVASTVEK